MNQEAAHSTPAAGTRSRVKLRWTQDDILFVRTAKQKGGSALPQQASRLKIQKLEA
jgi:hypothetical protein